MQLSNNGSTTVGNHYHAENADWMRGQRLHRSDLAWMVCASLHVHVKPVTIALPASMAYKSARDWPGVSEAIIRGERVRPFNALREHIYWASSNAWCEAQRIYFEETVWEPLKTRQKLCLTLGLKSKRL